MAKSSKQNIVTIVRGNKIPTSFNGRKIFFFENYNTRALNKIKIGCNINVYNHTKLSKLIHKNHYENFKIKNKDLKNTVIKAVVTNKTYTIKERNVFKRQILFCEPHIEVVVNNEKYDIISNETIMGSQRIGYILNSPLHSSLNVLNRNAEELTIKQYLQKLNNLKKVVEFVLPKNINLLENINDSITKVNKQWIILKCKIKK